MSADRHQVKLTKDEIKAALNNLCAQAISYGINDELYDRFNYLAKRLLTIQAGKPTIETEQSENAASDTPSIPEANKGWA